ncbi:MAG: exo-alpha-sialidase [Chloroflexi bacterium]|nr:exo-alpha-sialidase [Chloroflexota bacterium]
MAPPEIRYRIELMPVRSGYDGHTCWVHGRAGAIPGDPPTVVLTMQRLLLSGSDVFYALHEMRTEDLGATWSAPLAHEETLGRREETDGVVACICDFTPAWHARTGVLLGTGQVARYVGDRLMPDPRPRETAYSVYDPDARRWTPWRSLEMPGGRDGPFFSAGAGSTQRVDLPDGEILLPIYFHGAAERYSSVAVARCSFDGETLQYVEHGSAHTVPIGRGMHEPSLAQHGGRYYLTIRNDERGYVASSDDGLRFSEPRPWTWDDGSDLGNHNTQQHWVTHPDGLFLVYTRRGAANDHVFRHRAPLFIARVDPERLCVLRETERVLIPERGARLGNFGVVAVTPGETWVTACEWMQPAGCERYGSDNTLWIARLLWEG